MHVAFTKADFLHHSLLVHIEHVHNQKTSSGEDESDEPQLAKMKPLKPRNKILSDSEDDNEGDNSSGNTEESDDENSGNGEGSGNEKGGGGGEGSGNGGGSGDGEDGSGNGEECGDERSGNGEESANEEEGGGGEGSGNGGGSGDGEDSSGNGEEHGDERNGNGDGLEGCGDGSGNGEEGGDESSRNGEEGSGGGDCSGNGEEVNGKGCGGTLDMSSIATMGRGLSDGYIYTGLAPLHIGTMGRGPRIEGIRYRCSRNDYADVAAAITLNSTDSGNGECKGDNFE